MRGAALREGVVRARMKAGSPSFVARVTAAGRREWRVVNGEPDITSA
jgi:hypothetical protein